MADQASVSHGGGGNGNGASVVGKIAGLGNDVLNLAELQLQLASVDLKETTDRAKLPVLLVAGGAGLLLGGLPVLLLGVAFVLAEALQLSQGWMMLLTAVAALIAGAGLIVIAGGRLAASFDSFQRSREELVRNISWIRTVLMYSGRDRR